MLMQSHDGVIRLAPAWPERWQAQYRLHARGGFIVTGDVAQGQVRYALIESTRGGLCVVANPWEEKALVTCAGKSVLSSGQPQLSFATDAGKTYRLEPAARPLAGLALARLAPKAAEGAKWVGKLPAYPKWTSTLHLGMDEQGRTPARAWMARTLEAFARQLAEATAGLTDLSTGQASVSVSAKEGKVAAPALLTDGSFGPYATVEVPHEGCVTVDLGQAREIGAVVWSGDRTALLAAQPTAGFTVETSLDGQVWQMAKDSRKSGGLASGLAVKLAPVKARYLRLQMWGQYNRAVLFDEVTVFGK
jgi:hypothetical protein